MNEFIRGDQLNYFKYRQNITTGCVFVHTCVCICLSIRPFSGNESSGALNRRAQQFSYTSFGVDEFHGDGQG